MYTRHIARSTILAAILTLAIFAGAATLAQEESTVVVSPESDQSSGELRDIAVLAPRLVESSSTTSGPVASGNRLEEITVRGQRSLTAYRLEVVAARERVWDVFNEINSDDRFDISCSRRSRTGSRIANRVCRPRYSDQATSEAGRELARRVQLSCPPPPSAQCLEAAYAAATAQAQRYLGEIAYMDQRLDEEAQWLVRENPQFAIAILDYQAKQRAYEEARQRR